MDLKSRREFIKQMLLERPQRTNTEIAKDTKIDESTVRKIRHELRDSNVFNKLSANSGAPELPRNPLQSRSNPLITKKDGDQRRTYNRPRKSQPTPSPIPTMKPQPASAPIVSTKPEPDPILEIQEVIKIANKHMKNDKVKGQLKGEYDNLITIAQNIIYLWNPERASANLSHSLE
jgi:hypothetical protein